MTPPALVIRLPLEGRVRFVAEVANESEHARLDDWLAASPGRLRLIALALEIDDPAEAEAA